MTDEQKLLIANILRSLSPEDLGAVAALSLRQLAEVNRELSTLLLLGSRELMRRDHSQLVKLVQGDVTVMAVRGPVVQGAAEVFHRAIQKASEAGGDTVIRERRL